MQGNIQKETDKLKEKKLRYCDKTTKFEKILILFDVFSVMSNQVGGFLWPFQKTWTLSLQEVLQLQKELEMKKLAWKPA